MGLKIIKKYCVRVQQFLILLNFINITDLLYSKKHAQVSVIIKFINYMNDSGVNEKKESKCKCFIVSFLTY